ncbi:hypothetical protein BDP81DRAFT_29225 [Colletotrichum phormii]|uniref:Secreted protein n=1 Tax=Colletotrichum phormii TaxID=359342 RepID=A0AAI9ZRG5_9PEZI|nr:uncharacterized protein BDP81DRAFT_29225 [Colletotrichum phormii]KAK1636826.1 hypothetical protein BDP81DRAFT_29225 [Colletotrichum phormii]
MLSICFAVSVLFCGQQSSLGNAIRSRRIFAPRSSSVYWRTGEKARDHMGKAREPGPSPEANPGFRLFVDRLCFTAFAGIMPSMVTSAGVRMSVERLHVLMSIADLGILQNFPETLTSDNLSQDIVVSQISQSGPRRK